MLEGDPVAVDPPALSRGLHHRVLTGDVVGGHRHIGDLRDRPDDVEVGERRLHHHHIGPLGEVEGDLPNRLAGIRGIHLVAGPVPLLRRALRRLPEGAVVGRGILRRIRHDRGLRVTGLVEGLPDHPDLPVHHAAGRHEVGPGLGLSDGRPSVELEGGVVEDRPTFEHAAVSVVGVLTQAEVAHDDGVVAELLLQGRESSLGDALGIVGGRAGRVLLVGDTEDEEPADPVGGEFPRLLPQRLEGVLHVPRHGRDRLRGVDAFLHEDRSDQVAREDVDLPDELPQGRRPAEAPGSVEGEGRHGSSVAQRPTAPRARLSDPAGPRPKRQRAPGWCAPPPPRRRRDPPRGRRRRSPDRCSRRGHRPEASPRARRSSARCCRR